MNLLKEIFNWVKQLPAWQQDAARRLYEKPDGLSDSDYQELCRLALKENGLSPEETLEPISLDVDCIQQDASEHTLTLLSLGNLHHVNKIGSSQKLSFSPTGMTIVFGSNGTGKSGYARVFKRACFCRDAREEILPDVAIDEEQNAIATATFEVEYDGIRRKIEWKNGQNNSELAYISVFDSKVARMVLDSDQEPRYLPYGMDILTALGSDVLPRVKQEIESRGKAIDISENCFSALKGDTAVGRVFSNLSNVSIETVRNLARWTPEDMERGKYLSKFLADNNYQARIKENDFAIGRFESYISDIEKIVTSLNGEKVQRWKQVFQRWRTAKEAEALAAQNLRSGEDLLLGTGGEAWKLMFIKAQEFVAITHRANLKINDSAKCPLCQQKMGSEARARVKRFAEYIADQVSVDLRASENARTIAGEEIDAIVVQVIKTQTNLDEIEHFANGASEQYSHYVITCEQLKTALKDALVGVRLWEGLPKVDLEVLSTIKEIKVRLEKENADLRRAITESNLAALEKEREELRARYRLNQVMDTVESWFARRVQKTLLNSVSHGISTLGITNKIKELAMSAVNEPLRMAVDAEFKELGISSMRLRPTLVSKGKKGKLVNAFELGMAIRYPVGAVLSEGEQKVVAIASFMAELGVSGHKHAVVFDDPMTSLDHIRRSKVALRLAKEARTRQVIVFSHEPVFVSSLVRMCEKVKSGCSVLSLMWENNTCGCVMPGMPWEHKSIKTRIQELRQVQGALSKVITEYPSVEQADKIRKFYGRLRATIELVAQEVCLCGTVRRFEDEIKMAKLTEVLPLDANAVNDLYGLFGRCSDVFEGHNHASEANEPVPMPDEMRSDLDLLESIVTRIKATRIHERRHDRQKTAQSHI